MIVIIGKTCSGKDSVVNKLIDKYEYKQLISYTTRPMRKGEVQDRTYHFISEEEFLDKLNSGFFLEHKKYSTTDGVWYYGSAKEDYANSDDNTIVILTPSGLDALKVYITRQKVDIEIISIYIYANNRTIETRLKKRGDNKEEAARRIKADRVDFDRFQNVADRIFYNNDIDDLDTVVKNIHEYIEFRKGSTEWRREYI